MKNVTDVTAIVQSYALLSKQNTLRHHFREEAEDPVLRSYKKKLTPGQEKILDSIEQQLGRERLAESGRTCPECGRHFSVIIIENIVLDCCTYCGSYWFDDGELASLTGQSQDVPSDTSRKRKSRYNCPVCGLMMKEQIFLSPGNLLVDRCPDGHGVYLEAGELKRAFFAVNKNG